ncbi:uncharacterized protein F4822DRAFT_443590 [Hypoxylon trugodes]|uniref:uncharacterized protein n=1 Tax=Hypoxylon trugodes TaxID=326681 RepID=UPI0021954A2D|nr:uncharacterized protein F4822DRAFT_443590 [Hypoxylon trugodes]KAI1388759.1 hypothetical protein F4822DRAFT_443590 [Hypoxylon trugodes]
MSQPTLTPYEEAHLNESRQPALWGCLISFLVINDVAIAGRLWGTWRSVANRSRVIWEDFLIVLTGILVNVIIANLMVATHYGLGLHIEVVNHRDPDYPSNVSKTFRHVWITMVLMCSFFLAIKMTLLFFYKRVFLVNDPRLRIFWWANFVYIVLWFFGGTAFYLFQCKPVQWYFLQYYARYKKPVPGGLDGQCDATSVLHVSLPTIFSLISDVGLLLLPIWAISKLRLDKSKKRGLMAVFGIGLVAALLELARILALLLDTDDKNDPSYGVAVYLILTAAEETTAVVCACVPVIAPQLLRIYRGNSRDKSYVYQRNADQGSGKQSSRGFKRVVSLNHIWTMPTTIDASRVDTTQDDGIPLTSVDITGNPSSKSSRQDITSSYIRHQQQEQMGASNNQIERGHSPAYLPKITYVDPGNIVIPPTSDDIYVRTDIQVNVNKAV